jgi:hypothetical protein
MEEYVWFVIKQITFDYLNEIIVDDKKMPENNGFLKTKIVESLFKD